MLALAPTPHLSYGVAYACTCMSLEGSDHEVLPRAVPASGLCLAVEPGTVCHERAPGLSASVRSRKLLSFLRCLF